MLCVRILLHTHKNPLPGSFSSISSTEQKALICVIPNSFLLKKKSYCTIYICNHCHLIPTKTSIMRNNT